MNWETLQLVIPVSRERMCTILLNSLEDWAFPVKMWLGKLNSLDMTSLGWLGKKNLNMLVIHWLPYLTKLNKDERSYSSGAYGMRHWPKICFQENVHPVNSLVHRWDINLNKVLYIFFSCLRIHQQIVFVLPNWLRNFILFFRYKILFLDVLFPLDVKKIIFVDADQVINMFTYLLLSFA